MQLIEPQAVQRVLDSLRNQDLYLYLEMTTGSYASHRDSSRMTASTFVSNGVIQFAYGSIAGSGPYRIGLKTETGWVYSQGLTHWEDNGPDKLIVAGHDGEGKLVVGLQLSREPF